jgi:hypothetical protein
MTNIVFHSALYYVLRKMLSAGDCNIVFHTKTLSPSMPNNILQNDNQKLLPNQGEPYSDPERYRRLVGKLIYLTITRLDISFAVGVVSQFMQSPHKDHWDAVIRILKYIKIVFVKNKKRARS